MENSNQKVWYITGASKGLGLALVKQLINEGKKVAATSRSIEELKKAIGDVDNFLPLQVNLLSEESIEKSIQATVAQFGRVDVIVNNAGYGLAGALEELTDVEARQNFDVNVFGSLNVIRKVLPYLRKQQSGHIFNVSSIGGFTGAFPGFGIYCATKFAVQGFTESLAEEVKPFGIKATIVSPGYFRTDFLKDSSLSVPKNQLQEYKTVRDVQSAHENEINGNQPGDPHKAALAFIRTAEMQNPPVHLFLGQDAYAMAEVKIQSVKENMEAVREYAAATGFDN
ncbi:SDR family oxidoreductase [Flavobacterium lindanitolerans]|uniref:NADP-dependent 3-hydroxy acid dehydrogenase YdfG n=1 Tax=Flavobacterium lindanitolerans TaxID=428988 RepID=A0A497V0P7_9FLAO|nr:SDR family oxidoreductase [Flavobacterium lindanitolerans]PKW20858.1 NADP-dependent 3-hydroxy acid dehydrogenase YdfG [Flavobacterium lindanitolerans]RLJ30503.1 NADP-dependent 3-hydroxy acid dehydrogenase YdfG [Flavobacterium lindanitolerans]